MTFSNKPSAKMRFSSTFKSSNQCLPSPDGLHIAHIRSSKLHIRSTRSLETKHTFSLPPELAAAISWFLWSPASSAILVGTTDHIRVYLINDAKFRATIAHPSSIAKATFVTFGANDYEICVFSDFGLKLSIFSLDTSKSVDINSPKFFNAGTAPRGLSYRPHTSHLALLTRNGGKDVISIHSPGILDVVRSWFPDTIDAQGIQWSSDGRWLMTWESASQGHRILMYTADGHLFKSWNGPLPVSDEDNENGLGAGIKLLDWSKEGTQLAIGDYGRRVVVLSAPGLTESISLLHHTAVKPAESLMIWQEQLDHSKSSRSKRAFVKATQAICPPTVSNGLLSPSEIKTGTNILAFDITNTLLLTRSEDMPTTLWIWNIKTKVLQTVLILHATIMKATWHSSFRELLMIRCEGDENKGLAHIWEASWDSPKIIDFSACIPGGKVLGKTVIRWLNMDCPHPIIFFSDSQDCMLASLSGPEDGDLPWDETQPECEMNPEREESPLNLVPSPEKSLNYKRSSMDDMTENSFTAMSAGSEEMEDTFQFKKFVEPKDSTSSWF